MPLRLIALLCSLLATITAFSEEEEHNTLIVSTPEQIATLSNESHLIGGLISPLSGQPLVQNTDLLIKGAQPITLYRTYLPPHMPCTFGQHKKQQEDQYRRSFYYYLSDHYKGWQFYPHIWLELTPSSGQVRVSETNGLTLDFRLSDSSLVLLPYALTNTSGEEPHGQYDPRNIRITYEGDRITVQTPNGTRRIYLKKIGFADRFFYFLDKEILPSGKILKYHYDQNRQLHTIQSLDPQERYIYASLHVSGHPANNHCHFTASSGQTVDYHYYKRPIQWKLEEKDRQGKTKLMFDGFCPPQLIAVSSPHYRHESLNYNEPFLLSDDAGKEEHFHAAYAPFGEPNHYRIQALHLPSQPNDSFTPVYQITYDPPIAGEKNGTTTVKNQDGTSTLYHFSKSLLFTLIQYFDERGKLQKEKAFDWNGNHWLNSIELRSKQELFYRKTFEYDRFANPILETLFGDLTGDGHLDTYTITRIFSQDGRNLLLNETTEDGKTISFAYLPNTNLITSKLTQDHDQIILREFFFYDDSHNLIKTLIDDGDSEDPNHLSHVSQRHLKTYLLRQSPPFLHLPEWIEETYWEKGTEKPLKKTHLVYDQQGNIAEEEVYDAKGKHAYTISKTYNERGDVLTETNPLGQQASHTFDPKGRMETSTSFSNRIQKTFRHDLRGRLRELTEKGDDGILHITSAEYDVHDRQIHKQDPFGNHTHYKYDPLVNKVSQTDFPSIASVDGQPVAVSSASTYDPIGRELTHTDPNGHVTTYRYGFYGPTEILHPNGGKEQFRYAKNGQLADYTDPDGLTTHYKRDILGRVLFKTYLSPEGAVLAEEAFTYNGFNLLTETDKEGNVKQHAYDGAGRKIREEFSGRITEFDYDDLGRVASFIKHNGKHTLMIYYERDLEGRVLEERKTDVDGKLLHHLSYSYDEDGNQKTITRYIHGQKATETFVYDSWRRLTRHQDAEGHLTQISYDEQVRNGLGQKVLQKKTVDPRLVTTLETKDVLNRTVKVETLNPNADTIAGHELIHDPQGNILYRKDHVYEGEHYRTTQTIKYTYKPNHQVESLTRGYGTQEARTTTYTYFPSGKMETETLPDGITLSYSYHPLGFMSRLDSSDRKIRHAFEYNRLGYLLHALDENQHLAIHREVDPFGNVLHESFPYGLEINKDYDDWGRAVSLRIKNQGEIVYDYDPLFLRKVSRISPRGEKLYEHVYEDYDLAGNLISEQLIGNLGQVSHIFDLRGNKSSISSPYFSEQCQYDSVGNLFSNTIDGAEHRYTYDGLSQLSSESSADQFSLYVHDSLYNRSQENGERHAFNDLNECLSRKSLGCSYDLNGNLTLKKTPLETYQFAYDPLNRLIEVSSTKEKVSFTYDVLGRRLSKAVYMPTATGWKIVMREHYLYDGLEEIGAFTAAGQAKNLKIQAKQKNHQIPVSVELSGQAFAPLLDVQENIRCLVNLKQSVTHRYDYTAFGEKDVLEDHFNPWRFASKRFDPEFGLIYFGKRYYDPQLARWITTDPVGLRDSTNLYQYVFNNPFRYVDKDGRFIQLALPLLIWGAEMVIPSLTAYVAPVIYGAIAGGVGYAGYKAVQALNANDKYATDNDQSSVEDLSFLSTMQRKKKGGVDEKLSEDPFNDPNLEDVSHPRAKEKGRYKFKDKNTGEIVEYDKGRPGEPGHEGHDHYHRPNPNTTNGKKDAYLDANGNPVPKGSEPSHLYPPEWIWWI
jgi:RHS repeat-associated protein